MTKDEITTKLMADLAVMSGSNEWWTKVGLAIHVDYLYKELATSLKNLTMFDDSTTSVVNTARYAIVKPVGVLTVLKILTITIDGEPLDFYTVEDLYKIDYKWRGLGAGTPWGWYFERGDLFTHISTVPKMASNTKKIGFEYAYKPDDLENSDEPKEPFTDGVILCDGAMSLAFSEPGGGRDLDMADNYYNRLLGHFAQNQKHVADVSRGFRSPEESIASASRVRLPSNYPSYSFDE